MNVMRRLKSIASGRTSISSDPGGDFGTKRVKVDQETEVNTNRESDIVDRSTTGLEQHMDSTSVETTASTSNLSSMPKTEKSGYEQLPKEMHQMRIRDDKTSSCDEKDMEPAVVSGNGTETGQIIATTVGGKNGQPKQICRALNYLHHVVGVCHRDIKPQNLLVNPHTHQLKICDFGSAKKLVPGEPNISYICSRYYRAPELIFGATEYTTAIDMWSVGCVLAELLLGQPLFPGESGVDQLVEIIKVLGTPTREEIKCMNPNYTEFKFPQIKAHPWHKVFHKRMPTEAVDLVSRLLQYSPNIRFTALEACAHPFFDDLREPNACLPNGRALPPLFNFTAQELAGASAELRERLIPKHARDGN
ncbi:hypothetical protein Tsubulata_038688 [Turnera subulata]|uniref:non-specific serine/threonine protein kinase n=2 Tax=Turnera subulata TaxID=218843 RepID=A0A9Q0FBL7_9ROSI|nr:hypothetical protein Tsubulata_038688 [Turnera subulata]